MPSKEEISEPKSNSIKNNFSKREDKGTKGLKTASPNSMSTKHGDQATTDESDEETEQLQYKVILLGDGSVGKTSIAVRHTENNFSGAYKQTIGVDFFLKHIVLPGDVHVALQIWDIGGQTIGGKMIQNYIFGAHAVLLVYDITNYESFQNIEDWYRLVRKTFHNKTMPRVALIGNKIDLSHMCAVTQEKHNLFAAENDINNYFLSAKTGEKVHYTFYRIAANLADVVLTKQEIEVSTEVVKAQIVDYPQNDTEINAPSLRRDNSRCVLQ